MKPALMIMDPHTLWPYAGIVGGLVLFALGLFARIKTKASLSWPRTSGLVLESSIKTDGSQGVRVVCPNVVYEYTVAGKTYRSSQLALEESDINDSNDARQRAEQHPVGQQVDVYYNPKNPKDAVLQVGDPTQGLLPFGMMIIGMIIAVFSIAWLNGFRLPGN